MRTGGGYPASVYPASVHKGAVRRLSALFEALRRHCLSHCTASVALHAQCSGVWGRGRITRRSGRLAHLKQGYCKEEAQQTIKHNLQKELAPKAPTWLLMNFDVSYKLDLLWKPSFRKTHIFQLYSFNNT
eukprot:4759339-Amphidinium_carterae.1